MSQNDAILFKFYRERYQTTQNVILSDSEGSDFSEFSDRNEILRPRHRWGFRMTKREYVI